MHKNRPFLFTLLILLVLDLLVFFTEIPSSFKKMDQTCFEQETEEVLNGLCEFEEEVEEESEFLCAGLRTSQQILIDFLNSCSKRLFHIPTTDATALACGWSMPLLI